MTGDMFLCDEDNAVLEAIRKRLAEEPPSAVVDESGHGPRHTAQGLHISRVGNRHWHSREVRPCSGKWHDEEQFSLASWESTDGPLAFCDCPC